MSLTPNDRPRLATLEDNGNLAKMTKKFKPLSLADIRRRRQEDEQAVALRLKRQQNWVDVESEINYKRMRLNAAMTVVVKTGIFQVQKYV